MEKKHLSEARPGEGCGDGPSRSCGTKIKICGLRRSQDAEAAARIRPDFAGFILSPGFRRSITLEEAAGLRRILDGTAGDGPGLPRIRTVGVFVDAPPAYVCDAARSGCIDMVQLHGREDDGYIRSIMAATGLPVIKAFRVRAKKDLEEAAASAADWVLLDSGTGTGKAFDWDLLEDFFRANAFREQDFRAVFPGGHTWFLAGGLSAQNAPAAIRRFWPTALDVSSKVETDGWKDPDKMRLFVETVRLTNEMARRQVSVRLTNEMARRQASVRLTNEMARRQASEPGITDAQAPGRGKGL